MNQYVSPHIEWAPLLPIAILLGTALVAVLVEAFVPNRPRRVVQLVLALAGVVGSFIALLPLWDSISTGQPYSVLNGNVVVDGPAFLLQALILVVTLVSLLVIADRSQVGDGHFAAAAAAVPGSDYEEVTRRAGLVQTEVYPLVLFAAGGMGLLASTANLLTLFVALEVLSLPLYILSGLARRRRLLSQEAAFKYFVLGAFASALLLFGAVLLYGYSGSLTFEDLMTPAQAMIGYDGLLIAGYILVAVGLLFKIGAVPFHAWTPDVYQGAPSPITGFMAAGTKAAAVIALLRVLISAGYENLETMEPVLWGITILTMIVGTVIALVQSNIKRMLAYSSIAHAGFILVAVLPFTGMGVVAVFFYLLAYGLATIGAFAVVGLVRQTRLGPNGEHVVLGEADEISQWAGLAKRNPALALAFTIFLLSFTGIPLTAGFIGKFEAFRAAIAVGYWPLAVVGVVASAAAAFFYIRVIVLMYFTKPDPEPTTAGEVGVATVRSEGPAAVVIALCAAATVVFGIFPGLVLDFLTKVAALVTLN